MTSWAFAAPFRLSLAGTVGLAADFEAVAGSGSLTVGAQIATLSVTSESGSGSRPYAATVLPLRGEVPSGSHVSNAAGTEAGAILSTHDDGSAAVVVFASTASATGSVALHAATGTAPAALTAAAIVAQVSSVAIAFGSPYGTASITDFSAPERVWWAASKVYCARYRVAAPTPGTTALEAVIDIHAYAGRALVEVVIENGKMTTASPTKPTAASYTGATVSINGGGAVVTVNSADMPTEAAHSAFRGWYAGGWVGAGSTGLRVTQSHTELQQHPLLFKCDQAATFDMAGYASDAYTPWSTGRQRAAGMGSSGDHPSIGPLPQWEARALQSGDRRAWQATEASALACIGYNINYRDSGTGLPPTFTQLKANNVSQNGYTSGEAQFWPSQSNGSDAMQWKVTHHPAAGLMAFIARPSPVFIELAQKIAVWNGTWSVTGVSPVTLTGIFGHNYETRGRAWCLRSLAHASFLTPDAHPWKAPALTSISDNITWLDAYRTDSKALLNAVWENRPNAAVDLYALGTNAFGVAMWMQHYLATEVGKLASAGLLSGASQTAADTLADWLLAQPARWVNEQSGGGWRYMPYVTNIGRDQTTIDSLSTYGAQMDYWFSDSPAALPGVWKTPLAGSPSVTTYAGYVTAGAAGGTYESYFWAALNAAVDRGVAGASAAWLAVVAGISDFATWRLGFGSDPRWGSTPRNPPGAPAWVAGIGTSAWTEIATSQNFQTWAATALAPVSGSYRPNNLGAIESIRDAYCQPVFDASANTFYLFGGGHQDGSCNAVAAFTASTLEYSVAVAATPPSKYPSSYTQANSPVIYPSGSNSGFFQSTATLTDPADIALAAPFAAPTSTHTYDALTVSDGKLQRHYGPMFAEADLTAGNWSYVAATPYSAQFFAQSTNYANTYLGINSCCHYDSATGKVWSTFQPGDNAPSWRSHLIRIDPTTHTVDTYIQLASGAGVGLDGRESLCHSGRYLYCFGASTVGAQAVVNRAWRLNMDTQELIFYSLTGATAAWTNGAASQECCPSFHNGTYGYLWTYSADVDALYRVDFDTHSSGAGTFASPYVIGSTRVTLSASGIGAVAKTYRLDYVPEWSVVMLLPRANAKWWALAI